VITAAPQVAAATTTVAGDSAAQRKVLDQFCSGCHGQRAKAAKMDSAVRLTVDDLDLTKIRDHADVWEKVVRKLRAGLMPPTNSRRPDAATMNSLITYLEGELDRTAETHLPAPGLHRLNRAEYTNAVRDLLGLEVDASKFLPPDDSSHGFDNMAGTLTLSPPAESVVWRWAARPPLGRLFSTCPRILPRTIASKDCPSAHAEGC
jgi:mono/diheme cytochrome c family protein